MKTLRCTNYVYRHSHVHSKFLVRAKLPKHGKFNVPEKDKATKFEMDEMESTLLNCHATTRAALSSLETRLYIEITTKPILDTAGTTLVR